MSTPVTEIPVTLRVVAAITAGMMVGYLAGDMLPEVVSALQDGMGLSAASAGAAATAILLSTAGSGMIFGRRADAPGRARLAVIGGVLSIAGYAAAALSQTPVLLVPLAMLAGFGSGIVLSCATAAVSVTANPERTTGWAVLIGAIATALMLLVLPMVADSQTTPTFLFLAGVGLIGLPFLRLLPDAPVGASGATELPDMRIGVSLFVGTLLFDITDNGLWAFVSDLGSDRAGLSDQTLAVVFAAGAIAGLAGAAIPVLTGNRWGLFKPVMIVLLVDIAFKIVLITVPVAGVFISGELIWSAAYSALFAYLLAAGGCLDVAGRWAALIAAAYAFGDAIGPLIMGIASEFGGITALNAVVVVSSIAVVYLLASGTKAVDRKVGRNAEIRSATL